MQSFFRKLINQETNLLMKFIFIPHFVTHRFFHIRQKLVIFIIIKYWKRDFKIGLHTFDFFFVKKKNVVLTLTIGIDMYAFLLTNALFNSGQVSGPWPNITKKSPLWGWRKIHGIECKLNFMFFAISPKQALNKYFLLN